jgi:membrane fusion protein, multidrug efflux system
VAWASESWRPLWVVLALAWVGCTRQVENPGPALPIVTVSEVDRGPVSDLLSVSGTLEPLPGRSAKLGVLVPGRLAELDVAEGDAVHRGQRLARLEPTPFRDSQTQAQAALQQAQAQAMNARQHLTRAADLWDAGAGPEKDVEDAQAQFAAAQSAVKANAAALSLALNQSTRGEIVAPMDSIVSHVYAAVGEPMDGSGKPVLEVDQVDLLELQGGVSAARASQVSPGQSAEISVSGRSAIERGVVRAISPAVDPASGLVRVRIQLANPEARLKVGVTAEARIVLRVVPMAIRVPLAALIPSRSASLDVFTNVLTADGLSHRRRVEVGVKDASYAEILTGLSAGERVILGGAYSLPDGTPVQVADGGVAGGKPE